MMKLMLYTTLNVHGKALPYKIYYNLNENKYLFKPDLLNFDLPVFHIWKQKSHWVFDGLNEKEVQQQAIEDMENLIEMRVEPIL